MDPNRRNTYLQKCRDLIAKHGHLIQHVAGEIPFSYTVGLTPTLGYELVTIGLPQSVAHSLLNDLAARLASEAIADDAGIDRLANMPLRLRTAPVLDPATGRTRREILSIAFQLDYQPTTYRQLVWPDPAGHFPDDPHYSSACPQSVDALIDPEIGH